MGSGLEKNTKLEKRSRRLQFIFLLLIVFGFAVPVQGFALKSCKISREEVTCSNNQLKTVPQDIPLQVKAIDLSQNEISVLRERDFEIRPCLFTLDLHKNSIAQIDFGAFANLTSLKNLNLHSNKLRKLTNGMFQGLSSLSELRIASNSISEVEADAFKSMTSLKFLDISGSKLKDISTLHLILKHLPHLQTLYVSNNKLTDFQSSDLKNSTFALRNLDLSGNPIAVFNLTENILPNLRSLRIGRTPKELQMKWEVRNPTFLSNVSNLDISGLSMSLGDKTTLLETVNSSLKSLFMNGMRENLKELINISCTILNMSMLSLRGNTLNVILSDLFAQCTNVLELDVTSSAIREISNDAFKSMKRLKRLNLSHNKLSSVPAVIKNLPSLTSLDLNSNGINALGCDDFANLTKLVNLFLHNNSIRILQKCVFKDLIQLKLLKLETNKIDKLNQTFKNHLPNLKELHLNLNQITAVEQRDFEGLHSLQTLALEENLIKSLHHESFVGLTNLQTLLLKKNKIEKESVENGSFNVLIHLVRLDLTENMIQYSSNKSVFPSPFSKLSRLQDLSIRGQGHRGWGFLPLNFLEGLSNLTKFNARDMRLQSLHDDTFNCTPLLQILDLNSNDGLQISEALLYPLRNLQSLYISKTRLQSLEIFKQAELHKLVFLQAKKTCFSVVTADEIYSLPALEYVDFQGNSFTCDCDNIWFLIWVTNNMQTQVYDAYNFRCNYPPSTRNMKLLDFDIRPCSRDVNFLFFVTNTCAVLSFMVVSFTYHFMRWQIVYAYHIFLAWLADKKQKNRKNGPNKYDAFISYNTHDEPWVFRELLPTLEGEQGWKLCLHHRDFEPGKPIIENITDAIYSSRKTICVVSRRYLESEWCSREIQAASFRLFDEKKDVLILVFLEDIPPSHLSPYHRMRKLLKRQTYLSWPKAGEHVQLFWEKLRQAMKSGEDLDGGRFRINEQEIP